MPPDSAIQWKSYPALLAAACLALGITIGTKIPGEWLIALLIFAYMLLILTGHLLRISGRTLLNPAPVAWTISIGAILTLLGSVRLLDHQTIPPHHLVNITGHLETAGDHGADIALTGWIDDFPEAQPAGIRFTLRAEEISTGSQYAGVSGRLLVHLRRSQWGDVVTYPAVEYGDRIHLQGRLRPLPERRNPADFDYGQFLARRGIAGIMYLNSSEAVSVTGERRNLKRSFIVPLRRYIRSGLDRCVEDPGARAVLSALMLGDRSGLDHETRTQFAESGLMHLLAVSGLHVLLIGMIVYRLLQPVLLRLGIGHAKMERSRAALTMTLLVAYMLVTGSGPSVVRAVVMAGLLITGHLLQRRSPTLNSLGLAACILLIVRPTYLYDIGFQLSFAAVGSIVTINPVLVSAVPSHWREDGVRRWAAGLATVSTAATLGTMPVVLFHFGQVPFAGIVLNMVAIPATAATLSAGLLTGLFHGWVPFLGFTFGAAAEAAAQVLLYSASLGERYFQWTLIRGYVRDPLVLGCMITALTAVTQWPRPRNRWKLFIAGLLLATGGLWRSNVALAPASSMDVVFFDVGQADAALVRFPNGRHLLVDAGLRNPFTDSGRRVVIPHLRRFGITKVDAIVISHPHSDHMGGVLSILRETKVGRVIDNGQPFESRLYHEYLHVLDSLQITRESTLAGDTLLLDAGVRIKVLYPAYTPGTPADPNDYSVVLRIQYGETAFLFLGDAEVRAESRMTGSYESLLTADVIKVGHHGSITSSTNDLVAHASSDPRSRRKAVISVGRNNMYRHPSNEVLDRWRIAGFQVLKTKNEGAVWIRSDGESIRRIPWR